jgi:prepilin-type N-terminal cleavage/methylation domain-containing protein
MLNRRNKGNTLLELMVVISLIGIVIGMIFLYSNRGWNLFNKSLQYGRLQTDARSALEQMMYNIKRSSKDLVFVGNDYNSNVPLPNDWVFGKPYIYFVVPSKKIEYKERDIKSKNPSSIVIPPYDYYLYYIAKAKGADGGYSTNRARLKLFVIKSQDGPYTVAQTDHWPAMAPDLIEENNYEDPDDAVVKKIGQVSDIEYQDLSPEFDLYQSEFAYTYFNTNYEHLLKVRVKMVDLATNTKVDFESAVTPRD